ncbi:MAG: Zinc-regulated TonB-dependent outer membrane receptor [uncultured Thiotrichaceae bacterium]|uniref:Zinc-regulated TonB-dependent outer membrane receptor n=1 Tax=uncultured Thiotrichaceae bacterium TaxID=298394 RepID=A0A6S6TUY5_9GAMM|nr:MAG: Zinc-regulated TonB-dependent outer membrane receptor [uncultured Thiotrichaceae bacterium]
MKKLILASAVAAALSASTSFAESTTTNTSNWQGSFIFEGLYIDRSTAEELEIPGMPAGGHGHGLEDGLQAGHSEVVVTGNITEKLNARITAAILEGEDGEAVTAELEEAYVESQGLLTDGLNLKAGRMYTDIGYHSNKHNHEWDFADQPLVYEGMFGEHATGDGLQMQYVPATDTYMQFGSELFIDEEFPSGATDGAISAATLYAKVGGDIGTDHSWLAGIGHWQAMDITDRSSEAHDHGGGAAETPRFSGDSTINTVNALYKWAPNGNAKERNLKLQFEYFQRNEDGQIDMVEEDGNFDESSTYDGDQSGWYLQSVYQFRPQWRVGVRHDRLKIDNTGSDTDVLEEAELLSEGHTPQRNSIMVDYSPREYSRLRLQFNRDERSPVEDDQVVLQYIHSFGSHGAHAF